MKGQFVIVNLLTMDFMKDDDGIIKYYESESEAIWVCGMYEFENVWVMQLIHNHIEN